MPKYPEPMPRIADILTQASGPTLSVEFFPPKTPVGDANLQQTIEDLRAVPLSFVSVTYGAGGSTRDRTRDLVVDINEHESYPAMAHLTCIGHTKPELEGLLDELNSNLRPKIEKPVREQPLLALGIAAGVGLLAGLLLASGRRSA